MTRKDRLAMRRAFTNAVPNYDKKILIECASYKDPDLLNTVYSAIIQADAPSRVFFAVCYQDDDPMILDKLRAVKNMRIYHMTVREARGACAARYYCQGLLEDEDFTFHIDSHMRFVKHWDTLIIRAWKELDDPKGIFTVYPPGIKDEQRRLKLDDPFFDELHLGGYFYVHGFHEGFKTPRPAYRANLHESKNAPFALKRSPFIAGGYAFGPAQADRDVRFDPNMYHYGDEFPMAVRLFTHGYNFYNPKECHCWHAYLRSERTMPSGKALQSDEDARVMSLLGLGSDMDLGEFGLGSERTVHEYEKFAGLDLKNRTFTENAGKGIFGT